MIIAFTQTNRFLKSNQTDAANLAAATMVVEQVGKAVAQQRDLLLLGWSATVVGNEIEFVWNLKTTPEVEPAYPTLPLVAQWMTRAMAGGVQGALGLGEMTSESIT